MAQPIAPDYNQQFLFPQALEDWIPADHPARFLREFIDQLALVALGFAQPAADGRPPYAPSRLLKIWLYGYFHRIRSTRKLEAACREHLGLLWLSGLIQPDHNSLWRFWRDHRPALRALFQQTVRLAVRTGAVGLVRQALDGTKIEAAASGYRGWSQPYMAKLLAQLDAALDQTEQKIAEESADGDTPGYRLPADLTQRQTLRDQIQTGLAQLAADGRQHYHPLEPEARRMKVGSTNRYAYNAQAVADAQEGIVVACAATRQESAAGHLAPLTQQARENLGVTAASTVTVADTGYGSGADLQAAAAQGLAVLVPPAEGAPRPRQSLRHPTLYLRRDHCDRHLSPRPPARSRRPHHQTRHARATLPLSPPRLPRARPLHARPPRPPDRSLAPHDGRPSHARAAARASPARLLATAGSNHRAALWPTQSTRRLSPLDGEGLGSGASAMGSGMRDPELASALSALASGDHGRRSPCCRARRQRLRT